MIKYIALIILIYAGVANAQTFQVVTKVAYENERITAYNSLNKVIYQVDCKDFAYQFNSDGSIKIWDDIHAYTLYANALTVPTFASVVDSLKLWQKRCSIPALNMPSNMDSTHMDTSMVVPFILENIYYNQNKDTSNIYKLNEIYDIIGVINSRGLDSSQVDTSLILPTLISNFSVNNNDTLSAILQTIKTIDVADTSNLWMINEVYNQLGLINARAYDTSQVDTSMIEPFIIESFSNRNNDTLSAILAAIAAHKDTSNYYILDSINYRLSLLDKSDIDTSLVLPDILAKFATKNNDTLSAILLALNNLTPNDTSNFWIFDSIYQELKAVDTLCFTGEIAVSDSLLRTTVVDCGGTNAIAVKMCEGDTTNQFILKDIYKKIDTTINATIREMRDSIARQNIILLNQSTPTIMAATPSYTSNRTLFTANTTPAAYSVGVPANTREITIQNITGADIQITTSQGTQILGTMNNITLSNPNNTTINHAVFTANITISFFSSVLGDISGVAPRVIIDFKAY